MIYSRPKGFHVKFKYELGSTECTVKLTWYISSWKNIVLSGPWRLAGLSGTFYPNGMVGTLTELLVFPRQNPTDTTGLSNIVYAPFFRIRDFESFNIAYTRLVSRTDKPKPVFLV